MTHAQRIMSNIARIEAAAAELADAFHAVRAEIDAARRAAYAKAGKLGVDDLSHNLDRIAGEVTSLLLSHGLETVLDPAKVRGAQPIRDLSSIWAKRIRRGHLETGRTKRDPNAPWSPLPGQSLPSVSRSRGGSR